MKGNDMNMEIKWISENEVPSDQLIDDTEKKLGIQFPLDFLRIAKKYDGAYPVSNRYTLNGTQEIFNNLLAFDINDISNIIQTYHDSKDRLIDKLIPFGEDPFGNLICFDYRNGDVPSIVLWNHEVAFSNKEKAITFICNSFSDLLGMLHEAEDDE
ncbi:MAG: SMI1/KNR4 family protein [Anaerofustis sp.]